MEEKIDLKRFISIMKRRLVAIIVTILCVCLLTAVYSIFFFKPTYEATENILIGELKRVDGESGNTMETTMLLATTIDFIKSPTVLNSVKKELNITDDEFEKKVTVHNNRSSQIINIVVRDKDLEHTQEVSNAIAVTAVNKMGELFGVTEIKLLSAANGEPSVKQVGNLKLNIAIGIMIGIFLGLGVAMLKEYWNDSIKNAKEIEMILGVPVIGEVNLKDKKRLFRSKSKAKQKKTEILNRKNGGQVSV